MDSSHLATITSSPTSALVWALVTRLGEAQILLPVLLLTAAWMARRTGSHTDGHTQDRTAGHTDDHTDGRAGALTWVITTLGAALITTVTKVAFIGYEVGFAPWDYTGFSGHSMFAFAVWPVLLAVAAGRRGPAYFAAAAGVLLALIIAVSRVQVRAHSTADTVFGAAVGLVAAAITLRVVWNHGVGGGFPTWAPVLLLTWFVLTPSWAPASRSHDLVTRLSLVVSGRHAPYTRWQMHSRWRGQRAAESAVNARAGTR